MSDLSNLLGQEGLADYLTCPHLSFLIMKTLLHKILCMFGRHKIVYLTPLSCDTHPPLWMCKWCRTTGYGADFDNRAIARADDKYPPLTEVVTFCNRLTAAAEGGGE